MKGKVLMKEFSIFVAFSFCFCFTQVVFGGANNADIKCSTIDKSYKLDAFVPGDFASHRVTFIKQKVKIDWVDERGKSNSHLFSFGTVREKNYHFLLLNSDKSLIGVKFSMIPKTTRYRETANGERAEFEANVEGIIPGTKKKSEVLKMKCTYVHEI